MEIPIFCFVGRSGSGKTTFLERLIPILRHRGYRVGCIKHDVHSFEVDYPGKDTWRLTQAGSDWVAIANQERVAVMGRVQEQPSLDTLAQYFHEHVDLILAEGYRQAGKPRIEVVRSAKSTESMIPLGELFALVTDVPLTADCPIFALDDVDGVADLIEHNILNREQVKR